MKHATEGAARGEIIELTGGIRQKIEVGLRPTKPAKRFAK
jgi:hypothetical protein